MKVILRFKSIALVLCVVILVYGVRQIHGTAEEAVIKEMMPGVQVEFQGRHVAPFGLGQFLFFRQQAPAAPIAEFGYIPVKRNLWGQWRMGAGGKCSSINTAESANLVDFHAHYLWHPYSYDEIVAYSIVCGRTSSTQVQTVVVIWQDGIVTEEPVDQGWFLIMRPERQAACQLQLLDKTKGVIGTIDLAQFDFTTTDATTSLPACAANH